MQHAIWLFVLLLPATARSFHVAHLVYPSLVLQLTLIKRPCRLPHPLKTRTANEQSIPCIIQQVDSATCLSTNTMSVSLEEYFPGPFPFAI